MKYSTNFRLTLVFTSIVVSSVLNSVALADPVTDPYGLYKNLGDYEDPGFDKIKESRDGRGSTIKLTEKGHVQLSSGLYSGKTEFFNDIIQKKGGGLKLKLPVTSSVGWSKALQAYPRWYQHDNDAKSQIFRMLKGDVNRTEAFGMSAAMAKKGTGYVEWRGRYTFGSHVRGCIFQIFGNVKVMRLACSSMKDPKQTKLTFKRHGGGVSKGQKKGISTVAENLNGKSLDVMVRDNGKDYQVFIDGKLVIDAHWEGKGEGGRIGRFRWGMYKGQHGKAGSAQVLFVSNLRVGKVPEFIATWDTETVKSGQKEITIPIVSGIYHIDLNNNGLISKEDGDLLNLSGKQTIKFDSAGKHTIGIRHVSGDILMDLSKPDQAKQLAEILNWGSVQWKDGGKSFRERPHPKIDEYAGDL